jgi:RNA polymerase sigma-B factor
VLSSAVPRENDAPRPNRRAGGEREATILAHHYLCRRGARRFLRAGLEWDDLEQVAAIGLVKATDRYDPRAETPFEAFAWMMIVGELGHHVRDHEHLVRPPRDLRVLERRHARAWERLAQHLDREPRDAELCREIAVPMATVRELRVARGCAQPLNIDDPGLVPDLERTVSALRKREASLDEVIVVREGLERLSSVERQVIHGIYWFDLSRSELGRRLGISAKVVERLQRRALDRLRRFCAIAAKA